jgi:hypothetical protein
MGQLAVYTPAAPQRVHAWVLREDGVEEQVQPNAIAWTGVPSGSGMEVHPISTRCGSGRVRSSGPET